MTKISIVTPVYNNAATLEKALLSALNQPDVEIEMIVFDGGSTDGTVDILQQYDAQISHWVSQPDNGAQDALNQAIRKASGDIVSILCADDWLEPGILKRVVEVFENNPALDAVTTEAELCARAEDGSLKQLKHFKGKSQELSPLGTPMPNARFYRKSVYDRYGLFNEHNHRGQKMIAADLEMLLRLSLAGIKNQVLPEMGYHYFSHPGSMTFGGNAANERQMYDERADIAETYLQTPLRNHYAKRLKRWHRRGTLRLYFWHLAQGEMERAAAEKTRGLTISPIAWRLDYMRMKLAGKG